MECPCGAKRDYNECCGPIHTGKSEAKTAEALMRSRYSAFVVGDGDYLMKSWHPATRNMKEKKSIQQWAKQVKWLGLTIVSIKEGTEQDEQGWVTFKALYFEDGRAQQIFEHSYFERVNGKWVYRSGEHY